MKRKYMFMALLCCTLATLAQTTSQNYVRTRTMLNETGGKYVDKIEYFDGLGRPFQTVQKKVTPSGTNLVTLQEYDIAGREASSWLPIVSSADYVASATFKSSAPGNYGNDARPYSQPVYEDSPLNRVLKQYGAGAAWHNGHPKSAEYLTNTVTTPLNCTNYSVSSTGAPVSSGNYAAGQLSVVKFADEDSYVSYTFTDKQGHTVLTRRLKGNETHDTYYVYDEFSNLRFVLQPMYQSVANLNQYAFQYKYDGRNRCIWKMLPGTQHIEYVYDSADRLIFSQDGNQRANSKWTYYLYDALSRLTQQGECTGKSVSTNQVVHVQNFYDSYASLRTATGNNSNFPDDTSGNSKGSLTGSIISVLGGTTPIWSGYYYDVKGRITKTVENNLLSGYDITTTAYTFTNKPGTVTHTHTASGKTTHTEVYTYTYDQADRVNKIEHTLNGVKQIFSNYTYDELGRLSVKSFLNSRSTNQKYLYNIRGWLTEINEAHFSQNLNYNDGPGTPCYNGNISSMKWNCFNDITRGYKFSYDGLNRLKEADYGEGTSLSINTGRFSENITGYDMNGNIKELQRYGQTSSTNYGLIDNLNYTLAGNQLNRVDDASVTSAYNNGFEFKDAVKQTGEYAYDANGNLTKDLNKNISNITYNVLNLPSVVTFSDGSITYTYSADGIKLRTVHKTGSTTTTTDYCANVIYENGTAKYLLTEEGYVSLVNSLYHYYLKDHQGNVRMTIYRNDTDQKWRMEETNHYYPFGGVFANSTTAQPYKYNGKEYDAKKGLNWYDYGARHYDAALGRFTTIDPLGEKYYETSSYAYCLNNPIKFVDPTGKLVSPIYNEKGNLLGTDDEGLKGKAIIMNETDFKQGMSHEEAIGHSLGYNGLIDDVARSNYVTSYTGLKDRPDYDGYLTLKEANKWYKDGNGQPLFTSLGKIDLLGISSLGEKYVGQTKSFNLLIHSGSLNDGLIYGNITLKRYPNHSVRAFSDKYDFEMHNFRNPLNWGRNAETIIGRKVAGEGQSYEINIYGSKKLVPFLPWIK